MISNLQKKEFIKTIYEKILEDKNPEEVQKELMQLLIEDTGNGKMYKYRAFNEYALSNLKEGTLYCAIPSSFNDPFDCRIGIDINSYISATYGKELIGIEDCITKFVQVYKGKLLMDSCTEREKIVFHNWFNGEHLCALIKEYLGSEMTDAELVELLISNYDIIYELFSGYSSNDEFLKQVKLAKDVVPLWNNIGQEQRQQMISENSTFTDFARCAGVEEDADEIKLITLLHQMQKPEQGDIAKKLDEDLAKADLELGKSIDRQYRVGSICMDYKNRLMWSHYADGHKGFCIEYDFNQECDASKELLILPIVYSKERMKFPWNVVLAANKEDEKVKMEAAQTMMLSLLTKDEVWSYENEWRVIASNASGVENVKMPPISCIYIGALCSNKNKEILIGIANELKVPIKQMTVDRGEYTLHAQDCV